MTEIVIFHAGGTYDFEDDPQYFYEGARLFTEKTVQVTKNDLNWLQQERKLHGWLAWNLQAVLREMFERD